MAIFLRLLKNLPLAVLSPVVVLVSLIGLSLADLLHLLLGSRRTPADSTPDTGAASVVIPNWNGRDLLEKYLPSVLAATSHNSRNEVIVVDNGSTDGSAAFLRERFPSVKVVALPRNLGFGGGSNRGFEAASNDVVVLLNSDMRVAPDFLQPLLDGFSDESVFAVSCQIFFSDPERKREETGLTQAWWSEGTIRIRHRVDDAVQEIFPCFYGGGGSCAFDRKKFLELGGFDHLLRPFYLEDTDMGYLAWKRGWKVLYQPKSHVWHEHRGTIGKKFSRGYIDNTIRKNILLFTWKNIHSPARLLEHFAYAWTGAFVSVLAGDSMERSSFSALARAFLQLPEALSARMRARTLATIEDTEAFRRPMGGYFRDRFHNVTPGDRLSVVFLSPYPVSPPVHGGAVFMNQTIRQLGAIADVHLIALVDSPHEIASHQALEPVTASMEFLVRLEGLPARFASIQPYAVREFFSRDLEWLIHRQLYLKRADVLQIEYTNMGQYAGEFQRIACTLFEHDIYFQSVERSLGSRGPVTTIKAALEYLRALRYELRLLPRLDRVQVCTVHNRRYIESFLPAISTRIDDELRAGIDTSRYSFKSDGREPLTMLFLGSFRHTPNYEAVHWFLREVLPHIRREEPAARVILIGSDPPPEHTLPAHGGSVELLGFVDDVREALARYSVFLCPILSGSGVRVKLLEAFAAGIPAVSTRIGAEGLAESDGEICHLADDPAEFARSVLRLLRDREAAEAMARRARDYVVAHRDMAGMTRRLEISYRKALASKASSVS
jgi:GT2 family glycosyltransferase